jgi:hypothetical protein
MYLEAMKSKSLYCDVQPGILQKDFFVGAPLRVPLLGYYTPTRSTAYICRGTSPFIDVPAGAAVLMPDDLTMKVKAHEKSPDLFTDRGYNCPILIAKLRDDKAEKNHTLLYHILGDEGISYQVTTTIQALKGRGLKGIEAVYSPREDSHIQDGILVVQDSAEFIRDMLNAFFTEVTIIERHDNEEAVALANNKKWCLFAGDNRMQDEWTVPEKKMTIERIAG